MIIKVALFKLKVMNYKEEGETMINTKELTKHIAIILTVFAAIFFLSV